MTLDALFQTTIACATCMSDRGSQAYVAANSAVFIMLGCLVLVLGSIAAFVFHLVRGGQKNLEEADEQG